MNRKSVTRARRKEIMRLGRITEERWLSRDDDGTKYPKKDRGYTVHAEVNGYSIIAPDYNRFEAFKGMLEAARWAAEQKPFEKPYENQ